MTFAGKPTKPLSKKLQSISLIMSESDTANNLGLTPNRWRNVFLLFLDH
jgi:hypothetical protein